MFHILKNPQVHTIVDEMKCNEMNEMNEINHNFGESPAFPLHSNPHENMLLDHPTVSISLTSLVFHIIEG